MTYQIKLVERKQDGWIFNEPEFVTEGGIYEAELDIFRKAFLGLQSDGDKMGRFEKATSTEERKRIIWESIKIELDSIEDNLRTDLERSIKIFPLIKKPLHTGAGAWVTAMSKRDGVTIETIKAQDSGSKRRTDHD